METEHNYFEGKKFLVAGATSGIGYNITSSLLDKGSIVIATGRNIEKLESLKIRYNEEQLIIKTLDFSIQSSFENFAVFVDNLDGLVNAAGINQMIPAKLTDYNTLLYNMQVNFLGPVIFINKLLRKRMFNKGSSIVLLASIAACNISNVGLSNYSASKAALIGYIKSVALEISPYIRINSIAPGMIDTGTGMFADTMERMSEDDIQRDLSVYPMGRFGSPEDISSVVSFLLSSESSWITGQNFIIDGGRTLR